MARSLKKGPFIDHHLAAKVEKWEKLREELLELAAPADPVAFRDFDSLLNFLLCLLHVRSKVPSPDIGLDCDEALPIFPLDLIQPFSNFKMGDLA